MQSPGRQRFPIRLGKPRPKTGIIQVDLSQLPQPSLTKMSQRESLGCFWSATQPAAPGEGVICPHGQCEVVWSFVSAYEPAARLSTPNCRTPAGWEPSPFAGVRRHPAGSSQTTGETHLRRAR